MRPEQLAIALRPRSGWEAIDLGLRLAQHCARPLLLGVGLCVLAGAGLIVLLTWLLGEYSAFHEWGWLLLWWLKPFFDRVALHVLARSVFGETTDLRSLLRAIPGLLRSTRLWSALSWRRFDPMRTIRLPVDQLEGIPAKLARERRRLLPRRIGGAGTALIFCCSSFEGILILGIYALVAVLAPQGIDTQSPVLQFLLGNGGEPDLFAASVTVFCYAAGLCVIEPIFVAGGFALYLKRRTELEAWDVELQFRRLHGERAGLLASLLVGLCLGLAALLPVHRAEAADMPSREQAARQAKAGIAEVLKDPAFGIEKKHHRLSLRDEPKRNEKGEIAWLKPLLELLLRFGGIVAEAWRLLAWSALAIALAILAFITFRHIRKLDLSRQQRRPPSQLGGLDIAPESLPEDVPATARGLLAQGRAREALALLYRGALSRLAHGEGIDFERGDTEGDCVFRVTRAQSRSRAAFARLTLAWQAIAYAQRELAPADAEALCAEWAQQFGALQ